MKKLLFNLSFLSLLVGCSSTGELSKGAEQPLIQAEIKQSNQTVVEVCVIQPETRVSTEQSATEMVQSWLATKGWLEGFNVTADGRAFIVVTGYGIAAAQPDSSTYVESRMAAFDKAFLDAKKRMVGYLKETILSCAMHNAAMKSSEEENADERVFATLEQLSKGTLLEKEIDAVTSKLVNRNPQEASTATDLLMSKTFQQQMEQSAQATLSGMQAFYTVESHGSSDTHTEIGVVAVWSPSLAQMASAILRDNIVLAPRTPKKTIREQIPDQPELLSTFGVQQCIDEKGDLVLVSYAQAGSKVNNKTMERAAYDRALLRAKAQIHAFAGEMLQTQSATSTVEYEAIYNDEHETTVMGARSASQDSVSAIAQKAEVKGILQAKSWHAIHPISGKKVLGVVCTWSPKQKAFVPLMKADAVVAPASPSTPVEAVE
jgi:hypothetical protein